VSLETSLLRTYMHASIHTHSYLHCKNFNEGTYTYSFVWVSCFKFYTYIVIGRKKNCHSFKRTSSSASAYSHQGKVCILKLNWLQLPKLFH
jgi:hypothetical protein